MRKQQPIPTTEVHRVCELACAALRTLREITGSISFEDQSDLELLERYMQFLGRQTMTFVCEDLGFLQLALEEGIECRIEGFGGDFRFLSNFHLASIEVQGIVYPTLEHAYQAAKSNNRAERLQIASLETPGRAKRFGAKLQVCDEWVAQKLCVMKALLELKFMGIAELRQMLIATGGCYLEETNSWGDRFWDVCDGSGENHLGRLLMEIRFQIQSDLALPR